MAFRPVPAGGGLFAASRGAPRVPTPEFSTLEDDNAPWEEFCEQQRAEKPGISDEEIAEQLLSGDRPGDTALRTSAYRLLQSALPFHQRDALIRTPHGMKRIEPHITRDSNAEDQEVICRWPDISSENIVEMSPVRAPYACPNHICTALRCAKPHIDLSAVAVVADAAVQAKQAAACISSQESTGASVVAVSAATATAAATPAASAASFARATITRHIPYSRAKGGAATAADTAAKAAAADAAVPPAKVAAEPN